MCAILRIIIVIIIILYWQEQYRTILHQETKMQKQKIQTIVSVKKAKEYSQ